MKTSFLSSDIRTSGQSLLNVRIPVLLNTRSPGEIAGLPGESQDDRRTAQIPGSEIRPRFYR